MDIVGQILKKNRESKRISLLDVSKELKISEDILNNIENSILQSNIDRVFILGHLRSYCSFLNLNENILIEQFKKENFPIESKKIHIERPKLKNNLLFSNKVFSLSLIVIVFTTFYFLFVEVDKPSRKYAIIPDLPENYISIVEKTYLDNQNQDLDKDKDISKNLAKVDNNISSSSAVASVPKTKNEKPSIITLKFLDDTWVQIRDRNDEIVFSQLMNKDDEYLYDLELNYSITSGNAGHIMVLIDQKVKGKIGKKGQVVDSLVLNKDFNN